MRARAAALLSLLAFPVAANDTATWSGKTWARIQPTQAKGAVAEIVFHNANVNYSTDNGTGTVTLGGIDVELTFIWEVRADGADQIIATPPEGYFAIPEVLIVPEGETQTLLIYPETALGM